MINIQKLQTGHLSKLIELIRLYEDVFEMDKFVMPSDQYLQSLLDRNGLTFLVANKDEKIVGGLTSRTICPLPILRPMKSISMIWR